MSPRKSKRLETKSRGEATRRSEHKTEQIEAIEAESDDAKTEEENGEQDGLTGSKSESEGEKQDLGAPKGHKRKNRTKPEEPNKAQKISAPGETSSKASQIQVLKFLLSDAAVDICRPEDEAKDLATRKSDVRTYSNLLSPFEELLCAVVLSRPISHRLGLRTIRTILNPPYSFNNPEAIKEAGSEKVHQALWDARTQHKDKTANEIELIAEAVLDNDWNNDLHTMREKAKETVEEEREILRSSIKGLGKTGLDIFYRRIQWTWEEAYPFIDSRTQASIEKLELPGNVNELLQAIDENWNDLAYTDEEKYSDYEKRRRAFVLVLERAVGADLEKKIDQALDEASKL